MGKIKTDKELVRRYMAELRQFPCCACSKPGPSEISHIKSRGAGGSDEAHNILPKCRLCHIKWHAYGHTKFFAKYPHVLELLQRMGWELLNNGKLIHCEPDREADTEQDSDLS